MLELLGVTVCIISISSGRIPSERHSHHIYVSRHACMPSLCHFSFHKLRTLMWKESLDTDKKTNSSCPLY